jgi:hypothetical protein
MNIKHIRSFVFLLIALVGGCESELTTTTSQTGERKLVLNPTHLEAQQYDICTLRARITNMPISDAKFLWDLDEGQGFSREGSEIHTTFYENKVHTVRVKAIDAFNDASFGYDSLKVNVRPPVRFVKLIPSTTDTLMPIRNDGSLCCELKFTINASSPAWNLRKVWDFGDGTGEFVDSMSSVTYHRFARAGTHRVHVDVYERTGLHVGSGDTLITFQFPPFSVEQLATASSVSAFVDVGTQHEVINDSLFTNPLATTICTNCGSFAELSGVQASTSTVSASMDHDAGWIRLRDTIVAAFSDDHKKLLSVRVSVNDSGRLGGGVTDGYLKYTYALRDLELLVVNSQVIVYRSESDDINHFLFDLEFNALSHPNHHAGSLTGTGTPFIEQRKPAPFAVIVFTR